MLEFQSFSQNHCKDVVPKESISRMRTALGRLGFPLTEVWREDNCAKTYSLRLELGKHELGIGSNGKGCEKEYALASAYGELCERLGNQLFSLTSLYAAGQEKGYIDEKVVSLREALGQDDAFTALFLKQLGFFGIPAEIQEICLEELIGAEKIVMRPFYSWKKGKEEWIPWSFAGKFYGSNGMCAGNTPEEAIVQGMSEIVERHVQRQILQHPRALPDMPESVIRKFPQIDAMYQRLKALPGYRACLKDCSLGGRYPVAGFILAEKKTGCFGLKLGCHPNMGIAMERSITEAFQGMTENMFAKASRIDLANTQVSHFMNIYNTCKTAYGRYPWEALLQVEETEYSGWDKFDLCGSNREMLFAMADLLLSEGEDLLIRDVSFLGIPSYQILVPGISELLPVSELILRAAYSMRKTGALLRNPESVNADDLACMNRNARFWENSMLENSMSAQYGIPLHAKIPGDENARGLQYLKAISYYCMGETQKALESYQAWLSKEEKAGEDIPEFYRASFYYIQAKCGNAREDLTQALLKKFYETETVEKVAEIFGNPEKTFQKLYPKIKCYDCGGCSFAGQCDYQEMKKIMDRLWDLQTEYGLNQENITQFINTLRGRG